MEVTPYDKVYESFLFLIQKDKKFFNRSVPEERAKEIARTHMFSLLEIAVHRLTNSTNKDLEIDFESNMDNVNEQFLFTLNLTEVKLLAKLMFESYVEEKTIVFCNALENNGFTDSEIKYLINPNTTLKEFRENSSLLKVENDSEIYRYKTRGRQDNKVKRLDLSLLG